MSRLENCLNDKKKYPLTQLRELAHRFKIEIPRGMVGDDLRKYLCPRLIDALQKPPPKKETCVKETGVFYLTREAPPYVAKNCPHQRKRGNDGKIYESRPDAANRWRWYPVNPPKKEKAPTKAVIAKAPKTVTIEPEPKFDAASIDKFDLEKGWFMIEKISTAEKNADISKLKNFCRTLASLTREDYQNKIYMERLRPIFFFIKELIKKYQIDPQILIRELTPTAMQTNCRNLMRLIALSL